MERSIWLEEPYEARPPLSGEEKCSIAIIGGGIMGVTAAYFLAKRGCSVILLERETLGSGATGRSAGILFTGFPMPYAVVRQNHGPEKARALWKLSSENRLLLSGLVERERVACEFRPRGIYRAAEDPDVDTIRRSVEELRTDGFRVEWVEPFGPFLAATFHPDDAEFHPVRFVRGLAKAAERMGARIFERTPALALEGTTARCPQGLVRADMVLLATEAGSSGLQGFFDEVIAPVRGQCLVTEPISETVLPILSKSAWVRQLPDGRLLAFGGRHVSPNSEYTMAERTTQPVQSYLEDWLRRFVPSVADRRVTHRWAGIMAFTCDELPCVGPLPGSVDRYAVVGWHGSGLAFGVVCAHAVSEMMLDGRTRDSVGVFSLRRHL